MHITNQSKSLFRVFNQVYELERKIGQLTDSEGIMRQVRRMKDLFEQDFQLTYEDPIGQPFNETRTDVEARVAGDSADNLVIIETLKACYSLLAQSKAIGNRPKRYCRRRQTNGTTLNIRHHILK